MKTQLLFPKIYEDKLLQPLLAAMQMDKKEEEAFKQTLFRLTLSDLMTKIIANLPQEALILIKQIIDKPLSSEEKFNEITHLAQKYPASMQVIETYLMEDMPAFFERMSHEFLKDATDEQKLRYFSEVKKSRSSSI